MPSACTICKRNTKYSCITRRISVCVRVECSIAEEKEDTLGWDANRSVGYCLPCAGAAAGAGQNQFCSENRHPSDDIEPATLENESLGEERTDNFEPACELACESDLGDNERVQSTDRGRIETTDKPISLLKQESFSSTQPVSTFDFATLSSTFFLQTFSLAIN